jgi:hypothetical protein
MTTRSSGGWFAAALGLVVVLGVGSPATAADVAGTWKWTVERNGNTIENTLKLKQDGEKVTGTITGRQGTEVEIEDGKFKDDSVSFKVTRDFNGTKVVMKYQGKLSGDSIKGDTKFERDGQEQSRDWEAKRSK